jgi:serine phosphatase RsbU (regulator of sigma subunit)
VKGEWFARATELDPMGAVARDVDWAATSWGPPETWAPGLRSAVEICMSTRFPVLVTWGPDLLMFYNDGYRAMLGTDKQIGAMGAPVSAVWSEIWSELDPLFEHVLTTGTPYYMDDITLRINRSGYDEETWFAFCYSALRDEAGNVRGVLDISHETTDQVIDRRRLALVSTLSTRLHDATGDVDAVGVAVADVLGRSLDVAATELSLVVDGALLPLATTHLGGGVLHDSAEVAAALEDGRTRVVGDTLVAPLAGSRGESAIGLLVVSSGTGRELDERRRAFMELLAATVSVALSSSVRHMDEVGELRHVSTTLQESMLPTLTSSSDAVGRYLPATGSLAVGGDWYDSVMLDAGTVALVVGDCVGHGLGAAAVMAQLRTASRTLLLEGHGPAQTLSALDRFAADLPGAECTTVICTRLDLTTGEIDFARGGHLPALVAGRDSHRWLMGERGLPLGIAALGLGDLPERVDSTDVLAPDEILIVFTDGLVERRDEVLDVGLERLAASVRSALDGRSASDIDVGEVVDDVLRLMVPHGGSDDIALIAQRLPARPPSG